MGSDRLIELEEAVLKTNIQILGLSEIKRKGNQIIRTKNNNIFCFSGVEPGQKGVGFLIGGNWSNYIDEFRGINDRMALLKLKLDKNNFLTIIQIYAPTTAANEIQIDRFYSDLENCILELKLDKYHRLIIMGDFNSQIGARQLEEENIIGPYYYGTRNERGQRLVQFCQKFSLKIINSWFKKRKNRMWTWLSPNQIHKNQIDYMLVPSDYMNNLIYDFTVLQKFKFYSDHKPIVAHLNLSNWRRRPFKFSKLKGPHQNFKINPNNKMIYQNTLSNILQENQNLTNYDDTAVYLNSIITEKIREATLQTSSNLENRKNSSPEARLPKDIIELINKREKLKSLKNKSVTTKIELNVTCKLVRSKLRNYNKEKNNEFIKSILESTKSTKTIKKHLSLGTHLTTYLLDDNGREIYSRDKINELATRFYSNLYKNPDTSTPLSVHLGDDIEQIPKFLIDEIENIASQLKNGKALGSDGISNEQIKYGGKRLFKHLSILFNKVLETQSIPPDWQNSDIILIHKKGDRHKIDNYRPISISSTISKIFSKLIVSRITKILDNQQPREQAGFRKNFSTIDHLHTINQLIEKSNEYNFELHLAFVDYSKAFDSLNQDFAIKALINQGVPLGYVKIIQKIYSNLKARIKTDKLGDYFNIQKGVKQGDPLSPLIFNCALEEVFRDLNWKNKGLKIDGEHLNNLRFADDVVLVSDNITDLEIMLKELNEKSKLAGLKMNKEKTNILSKNPDLSIEIDDFKIPNINETIYLGQLISFENKMKKELNRRVALTWKKYWSLRAVFKGRYHNTLKSDIFNSCLVPVMTYGSQTWSLTKQEAKVIKTTQNSLERSILQIRKKDKLKISVIKGKLSRNRNMYHEFRRKKWDWAGHLSRMKDFRWSYKVTNWFLKKGRKVGRQRVRWRDDLVEFLQNQIFERVAADRLEWRRLREAYARHTGWR